VSEQAQAQGDESTVAGDTPTPLTPSILDDQDAALRLLVLTDLQAALAGSGVQAVLARNHRLVLRYSQAPLAPSGLTNPALHIFGPVGKRVATTDGITYRLDDGQEYPATDPAALAAHIRAS
jgi:hypothetical protein